MYVYSFPNSLDPYSLNIFMFIYLEEVLKGVQGEFEMDYLARSRVYPGASAFLPGSLVITLPTLVDFSPHLQYHTHFRTRGPQHAHHSAVRSKFLHSVTLSAAHDMLI